MFLRSYDSPGTVGTVRASFRIWWRPPYVHQAAAAWTRDWRVLLLPQVGTITVLDCVMVGAPASASRTPL